MAFSINEVKLIGNLGRDAEVKSTANGTTVCILNLATSESWQDKSTQEWKQDVEWHRVVFYGRPAESLAGLHLRTGETLYVSGKIKTRKWTDNNGNERSVVEIIGDTFVPHRPRNGNGGGKGQRPAPQQAQQRSSQQQAPQQRQQSAPAQPQQQAAQNQQQSQQDQENWDNDSFPF